MTKWIATVTGITLLTLFVSVTVIRQTGNRHKRYDPTKMGGEQTQTAPGIVAEIKTLLDQLLALVTPAPATPPAVTSVTVTTAAELQAALDSALPLVLVQPGTYTGNFVLKVKATPTEVRGLTFEGRATPTAAYPKLVAQNATVPVLATVAGAHDYTFVGLEFTGVAQDRNVIEIGVGATTLEQLPARIAFKQVYVHGTVAPFGHRGIYFDVLDGTIRDSYFSGFVEQGRDSQCIGIIQGGPFLVENNYCEASGEGMMVGGSDPKIPNMIPFDGVVKGNHFFKPLSWWQTYRSTAGVESHTWSSGATLLSGYPGATKNAFELKNAKGWTVTNNLMENVWADGQAGSSVLFTVRNQSGQCPWCNVKDVEFACNVIRNSGNYGINILGTDNLQPSGTAARINIHHNLIETAYRGMLISGGADYTIDSNVIVGLNAASGGFLAVSTPLAIPGFSFTNNKVHQGAYGILGNGTQAMGMPSLQQAAPGYVFTNNTVERTGTWPTYPAGTTFVAPGTVTAANWACQ